MMKWLSRPHPGMYAIFVAVGIREVVIREGLFRRGMGWVLVVYGTAKLALLAHARLFQRRKGC